MHLLYQKHVEMAKTPSPTLRNTKGAEGATGGHQTAFLGLLWHVIPCKSCRLWAAGRQLCSLCIPYGSAGSCIHWNAFLAVQTYALHSTCKEPSLYSLFGLF